MSRRIYRWPPLAAVAAVVALPAAACGSSTTSSTTTNTTTTAGPPATSSPTTATSSTGSNEHAAVTDYLKYTGGTAGSADASKTPVQIGWLNQQGGEIVPAPLATAGAETAVKYINAELGGVDGHPIKLDTCFVASSEQEGTTCGQQFDANHSLDAIDTGAVATGIEPFYSTLAGAKPVIVGVAVTPVDNVQKNATILFGDAIHVNAPIATYAKDVLHAKTAALIYSNIPSVVPGAQAVEAALKAAGITVHAVSYDSSETDLVGPLTSAGAASADVVIPMTNAPGCVNLAKSLTQVGITDGKKIVSFPLCLNAQVKQGLGSYPKWTYAIAASLFGDMTDPGMPAYMKVAEKYDVMADAPDPWFITSFSQILTTVRFMNEVGYAHLSPAAIEAKAKSFTGPLALGAPDLKCGTIASAPAVCNDRAQFFEYEGGTTFVKKAGWLVSPTS